jgi:hypothetical protein
VVPRRNLTHRSSASSQHRRKLDDLAPTARPIEDVAGKRINEHAPSIRIDEKIPAGYRALWIIEEHKVFGAKPLLGGIAKRAHSSAPQQYVRQNMEIKWVK